MSHNQRLCGKLSMTDGTEGLNAARGKPEKATGERPVAHTGIEYSGQASGGHVHDHLRAHVHAAAVGVIVFDDLKQNAGIRGEDCVLRQNIRAPFLL